MKNVIKTFALAAIAALALTGCIKHEPYGHRPYPDDGGGDGGHGGGGGNNQEQLIVREHAEWAIQYVGREDFLNDFGEIERVERFSHKYSGTGYFIIRIVRPEDFKNAYQSDAAGFFTYEAESLLADAKNDGVNFWQYTDEVFDAKTPDILFNRLRSGTWTAFLIELDNTGKVTGNYAETTFTLQQETASAAYNKWLGSWRVSNGLMGFDLDITALDNNFLYRIDGWERGQAVAFQMDQEYLEGEFWDPNGFLYIRSQFLGTYADDNLGTVDELFRGNIFDSNGLTIITDEGIDLAVMVPMDGGTAELQPMEVTLKTDSGDYTTKFHSMQYYMWAHKTGEWHPYNANVPQLPLTMTPLTRTRADEGLAPARERAATKASIHHSQPKAAQGARKSVAKKAVRMK